MRNKGFSFGGFDAVRDEPYAGKYAPFEVSAPYILSLLCIRASIRV